MGKISKLEIQAGKLKKKNAERQELTPVDPAVLEEITKAEEELKKAVKTLEEKEEEIKLVRAEIEKVKKQVKAKEDAQNEACEEEKEFNKKKTGLLKQVQVVKKAAKDMIPVWEEVAKALAKAKENGIPSCRQCNKAV